MDMKIDWFLLYNVYRSLARLSNTTLTIPGGNGISVDAALFSHFVTDVCPPDDIDVEFRAVNKELLEHL